MTCNKNKVEPETCVKSFYLKTDKNGKITCEKCSGNLENGQCKNFDEVETCDLTFYYDVEKKEDGEEIQTCKDCGEGAETCFSADYHYECDDGYSTIQTEVDNKKNVVCTKCTPS